MESFKKVLEDGTIEYNNILGKRHREDGPAVECENDNKEWWLNGKRHREDGPAVEEEDDNKEWFLNGKKHREDGPAVEYEDGTKRWYLNGEELSEEEFLKWQFKHSKTIKLNFQ